MEQIWHTSAFVNGCILDSLGFISVTEQTNNKKLKIFSFLSITKLKFSKLVKKSQNVCVEYKNYSLDVIKNPRFQQGFVLGANVVIIRYLFIRPAYAIEKAKDTKKTWTRYIVESSHSLFSLSLWKSYIYKKRLSSKALVPILLFTSGIIVGATGTALTTYFFDKYEATSLEDSLLNLQYLYGLLSKDFLNVNKAYEKAVSLHEKCWADNNSTVDVLKMASKIISKYNPNLDIVVPPFVAFPKYEKFTLPKNFEN